MGRYEDERAPNPTIVSYSNANKIVSEKPKKKKKRTTVKANAYAAEIKAKANANAREKAEANAREKANANKAAANANAKKTKRKHTRPAPRVRVRPLEADPLNLDLNDVDNPKRWNAFNNVRNTSVKLVTEKRKHTKPTPRVRVKGTSLNVLRPLSLMNRKEANQERRKVKGTPMNTKRRTFKDRKESALARIMETVNLSKAKNDLGQMAVPNSPGTKLAKDLKKEEEKYNKEWKKEQEDRNFDEKMPTFHQLATENGINDGVAHNLHQMSERANRNSVILNGPENTLPYFPGLVEKEKPKEPRPKPRPRGRAVPRRSTKNM